MLDKLTTPSDFDRAGTMLAARLVSRTGMGFDVHAFAGPGPLMLGGVEIAHERGLAGHSDADVVLHAITDALLGAAGLGDIGEHFPPRTRSGRAPPRRFSSPTPRNLIRDAGGIIDFVDCTVIAEAPKVGPHRAAMRSTVAEILGLRRTPGQHQGDDDRAARLHRARRRDCRAGGRDDPEGECVMSEYPASRRTGRQGARGRRRQSRRRAAPSRSPKAAPAGWSAPRSPKSPDRRKCSAPATLLIRTAARSPACASIPMSSTPSARSASPPPGRWRAARSRRRAPMSRWRSPESPAPTAAPPRNRSGRWSSRAPSKGASRRRFVADQKLFDASGGRSGVRLQAALCALDLLMP